MGAPVPEHTEGRWPGQVAINGDIDSVPVILLPAPIAEVVQRRACHKIFLRICWHVQYRLNRGRGPFAGPFPDWPPAKAPIWAHSGQIEPSYPLAEQDKFNSENLGDTCNAIRELASNLGSNLGHRLHHHELAEVKELAAGVIARVQRWRSSLEAKSLYITPAHYSSKTLVESIRLMKFCKNSGSLAEVLTRAVQLCMPDVY